LARAGILEKRCLTSTMVPTGDPAFETSLITPAFRSILVAEVCETGRVVKIISDTDAILGRASPLKPRV